MARLGRCKWTGVSGRRYRYAIYQLPCRFRAEQFGNYVFTKKNREGLWVPVFIGQGDLDLCCGERNPMWQRILERGATHFHCHLTTNEAHRRDERLDLLARYLNAYEPYGCNTWDDISSDSSTLETILTPHVRGTARS